MDQIKYTVLSPWAEPKVKEPLPLSPRLKDLSKARIGIIGLFKENHPALCKIVKEELSRRYPEMQVEIYIYIVDQRDPEADPLNWPDIKAFMDRNDGFILIGADGGSCSLFAGYIASTFEKYGKPMVMYVTDVYVSAATVGCAAKGFPHLRKVAQPLGMAFAPPGVNMEDLMRRTYAPTFIRYLDDVLDGLTRPLTEDESDPKPYDEPLYDRTFTGTLEELNNLFYKNGWTNGTPITPPTREAVDEMLRGTDLPADHVIGYLPPMYGKMTVEKLAINAVMAGCQPTHLPILIAIAKTLFDPACLRPFTTNANGYPETVIECMTTSTLGFAPLFVLNGPIRDDIQIATDRNYLTPYDRAKSAIPRAYAYMIMNISGVRGYMEDTSNTGHETRFGMIVAENEEQSPWEPLCCQFKTPDGKDRFQPGDNAVSVYFYVNRDLFTCIDAKSALSEMVNMRVYGQDSGFALAVPPNIAKSLADEELTPERIMNYIVKYGRRPFNKFPRGMKGNHHEPKNTVLPLEGDYEVEKYISTDHCMVFTAGNMGAVGSLGLAWLTDGGHGTPSCCKIDLPKDWDALVRQYKPAVERDPVKYY